MFELTDASYATCQWTIGKQILDRFRKITGRSSLKAAKSIIDAIESYRLAREVKQPIEPTPLSLYPEGWSKFAKRIIAIYLVHLNPHLPEESKQFLYNNPYLAEQIYEYIIHHIAFPVGWLNDLNPR
jgi:hypothetical protein